MCVVGVSQGGDHGDDRHQNHERGKALHKGILRPAGPCEDRAVVLAIDHLVVCVADLEEAAGRYRSELKLQSAPGGRHAGHGTQNRIVPLGSAYIELIAVVDQDEGQDSPFGRWVTANAGEPGADALVLRTDDLDEVCERLGLEPDSMSRLRPDGFELKWRLAGFDRMISHHLPFFIEWEVEDANLPGRTLVEPPNQLQGIDEVILRGALELLTRWTTGCDQVKVEQGPPGVVSARSQGVELI